MPRPTRARKQRIDLRSGVRRPKQVQVSQHQRLYAPRSNGRGVTTFLQNLSQFAENRRQEKNVELAEEAQTDFASGEIDEEKMQRPAYAGVVNALNGNADATDLATDVLANAERDIALAHEEGREWDVEDYYQKATEGLTSSPQFGQEDYARAATKPLNQLRTKLKALGAKKKAELELEEGINAVSSWAFSQFKTDGGLDAKKAKEVVDLAGLTRQEGDRAVVRAAESFLAQAQTPEDVDKVDAYIGTFSDGQQQLFGDDLAKARRQAINRVSALTAEEELELEIKSQQAERKLWTQAHQGELDWSATRQLENQGVISPETATSLFKQNVRAQEQKLTDAQDDAEKLEFRKFAQNVIQSPASYSQLDNTNKRKVREVFEEEHKAASNRLIQYATAIADADRAGDNAKIEGPEGLRDHLLKEAQGLSGYLKTSREMGFTPRWVKDYLSNAVDPSSPQFRAASEIAAVLEAEYGDDLLSDVTEEAMAKIDAYRRLKSVGLSDEQAVDVMTARSQVTLAESRSALRKDDKFTKSLDNAVEELVEDQEFNTGILFDTDVDVNNGGYARSLLADLASVHYRASGNAESAVEWAKQQFKRSHQLVDGAWMPTEGIPQGFGLRFQKDRDDFLKKLRDGGLIGEDEDFQLLPLTETAMTGRVALFKKAEGMAPGLVPVRDKDGRHAEIHPATYLEKALEQDEAERKEAGLENLREKRQEIEKGYNFRNRLGVGPEVPGADIPQTD